MGMSIRFCIGVIIIAISALSASLIGAAAAMGEVEAVVRFTRFSGFIAENWRELMSFGPVACMLLGCLGAGMMLSGLHLLSLRTDLDFS